MLIKQLKVKAEIYVHFTNNDKTFQGKYTYYSLKLGDSPYTVNGEKWIKMNLAIHSYYHGRLIVVLSLLFLFYVKSKSTN